MPGFHEYPNGPGTPKPTPTSSPAPGTGSTNPDGSFNPSGSAGNATTDPNSTHTDIYGLTAEQEAWTFYLGEDPRLIHQTQKQREAETRLRHANPDDKTGPFQAPFETALGLMKFYAKMGTSANASERQAFANFQNQLLAIGAYGSSGGPMLYRPGTWTDLDAKALMKAFQSYQQVAGPDGATQPITFSEYIDQTAGQSAANGQASSPSGGSGGGPPSRPTLTDPDTLKLYAEKAAQAALGRNLSSDELNLFVDQFHKEQTTSFNNALKGQGDVVDKADPRASAIQFVAQNNQQEAGSHQVLGYADALLNSMMSGSAQLPTPNVDPTAVGY